MRQIINLYLAGESVEFNQPPELVYNYTENDMTNPTVVKNSYSKTLTIEGTPHNNAIFGHFWDLERVQTYGVGSYSGTEFNALKKAEFTLYLNGEIYESGYFKLDEVRKTRNYIEYDITLYGGLGQFFYNLTYAAGDESAADGPQKMEISDLFSEADGLDFEITKETVKEAWDNLASGIVDECDNCGFTGNFGNVCPNCHSRSISHYKKWQTINFAPAYNGIPDDFDADKVLIDQSSVGIQLESSDNGYLLGTMPEQLTEWETMDLRSYLQRPVLNVKSVIERICDPNNNGGYNVELDPHFFHDSNPYWKDGWVTLPMLRQLEVKPSSSTVISGGSLTMVSNQRDFYRLDGISATNLNNVNMAIQIVFNPSTAVSGRIYTTHYYEAHGGITLQNFVRNYTYNSSIDVQMVGMKDGKVVGTSDVYHLVSMFIPSAMNDPSFSNLGQGFSSKDDFIPNVPVEKVNTIWGYFDNVDGQYVWCDLNGNPATINFNLGGTSSFDYVYLKIKNPISYKWNIIGVGNNQKGSNSNNLTPYFYTSQQISSNSWQNKSTVTARDQVYGSIGIVVNSIKSININYTNKTSGSLIPYTKLLKLGITPCDFLLSYTKMFGLYFYKEPDSNTIHIMDRDTFYQRDNIVDLEKLIDRGKTMRITPQLPSSKWYLYEQEPVGSQSMKDYFETYGQNYGSQRINTQYNFNADTTDLLDGQIFKSASMVLEKDKYFQQRFINYPTFIHNNMEYDTFTASGEKKGTYTLNVDIKRNCINPDGLGDYDNFAKVQLHEEENKAVEGGMVLLFYNGNKMVTDTTGKPVEYALSDDSNTMMELNDENPCWFVTGDSTKVIFTSQLPMFTRDITSPNGIISHTWNFGNPMEIYVPNTYTSNESTVYYRCWKNFITDIYSVNTRKLSCFCLLRERPNPNWLRRFYWFDNSIWRLNKINDWNISSYDTTEMEFIKVQDRNDYALDMISKAPAFYITLDKTTIGWEGGTITGTVYCQDGGSWYMDRGDYGLCNPNSSIDGVSTPITITIPRNDNGYTYGIGATTNGIDYVYVSITQTRKETSFSVVPDNIQIDWYTSAQLHYDTIFNRIDVTSQNNWTATYTETN